MNLQDRLREMLKGGGLDLPLPGRGDTAGRHHRLAEIAREDVALGRLAEAHADAVAILADAGRSPKPAMLYGVWAAETAGQPLRIERRESGMVVTGSKMFCSGAGLIDRALVTVTEPERLLVDVDLKSIRFDASMWKASAFSDTQTATADFPEIALCENDVLGPPGWYLNRPGFWHGACGPASCWAGGAIGLIDYAKAHSRDDPHSRAHFGAMKAAEWSLMALLESAGRQIDQQPEGYEEARDLALMLRHSVEQICLDVLRRFARSMGPRALAYDGEISRRYSEVDLYLRQCHGERDLEVLATS